MPKRTNPTRIPTAREYLIMAMVVLGVVVIVSLINFLAG
jgi:hypothetical protein